MKAASATGEKRYHEPPKLPRYGSLSQIVKQVPPGASVLDVGCADGYLAGYLPGRRVFGVDASAAAVEVANTLCEAAWVADLNDPAALSVVEHKFDVIVCADVLEHLLDPESILLRLREMLSPEGLLLVSLPNVGLWRVRLNLLLGRFDYADYGVMDRTHLHFYTFASGRRMLETTRYRVEGQVGAANLLGPVVRGIPAMRRLLSSQMVLAARRG